MSSGMMGWAKGLVADQLRGLGPKPFSHMSVVVLAVAFAPFGQRHEARVGPRLLTGMGKHEEHLQIAQVTGAEATGSTLFGSHIGFSPSELFEPRVASELA
jgi:hypothetical protein